MAEEFHDIVDVGSSDEHINSVNADGVLFAAVQGLSAQLEDKDDRIADLEADRDELKVEQNLLRDELDEKDDRIEQLEAETEHLQDRLARVENRLGLDGAGDPASADD